MDAFFHEAELARVQTAVSVPFYRHPTFNDAVERQLRDAWMAQPQNMFPHATAEGPCVAGKCQAMALTIRIWIASADKSTLPMDQILLLEAEGGKAVHVCEPRLCSMTDGLHGQDMTAKLRTIGLPCLQPSASGGGIFWCARHTRMHICTSTCRNTYTNQLGFKTCILSGQTVAQSMEFAYGQGVSIVSDETAKQRKIDVQRPSSRKRGPSALEQIIRESHGSRSDVGAGDGYQAVDLDAPADDLFSDEADGNSFGDGMAKTLLLAYTQAYATVYHIIFSKQRYDLEIEQADLLLKEARQKITQYMNDRAKQELPHFLDMSRQLETCALSKKHRLYPILMVPTGGKSRLQAYYAAVCMEFYVQLIAQLTIMTAETGAKKLTTKTKQEFERFMSFNVADVAPNIFDIMHEGLKIRTHVLVQMEPMFHNLFPESLVMDRLGFRQKTCTEVKKLLKKCVVLAVDAKRPIERLQTTSLDSNVVLRGTDPVLTLFIEARRKRLGMDV